MTVQPVRVLIADDSEDDRVIFAGELQTFPGFQLVGITPDGVETIAWLNATPPYSNRDKYPFPDLLLLDFQMPGYSGLEVLEWLHNQHPPRCPMVVLWSDSPDLIDQRKARHFGAHAVCAKPGTHSDFRTILARVSPQCCRAHAGPSLAPPFAARSTHRRGGRS